MATSTIEIFRHAESVHNLQGSHIRDPPLTPNGRWQCVQVREGYHFMNNIKYIVASPMSRTIETALVAFEPLIMAGTKVILLPELQELGERPSDTGSERERLEIIFGDRIDATRVTDNWLLKGPGTKFASDPDKIAERAREARAWLRGLAKQCDPDEHIVVVTHGAYVHWLTEDFRGLEIKVASTWHNADSRSYTFKNELDSETEHWNAPLLETDESLQGRLGPNFSRSSEDEKAEGKRWAVRRVHALAAHAQQLREVEAELAQAERDLKRS